MLKADGTRDKFLNGMLEILKVNGELLFGAIGAVIRLKQRHISSRVDFKNIGIL